MKTIAKLSIYFACFAIGICTHALLTMPTSTTIESSTSIPQGVHVELPEEIRYAEYGDFFMVERNDNDTLILGYYHSQN